MVVMKLVVKEPSENLKSKQLLPTPATINPLIYRDLNTYRTILNKFSEMLQPD